MNLINGLILNSRLLFRNNRLLFFSLFARNFKKRREGCDGGRQRVCLVVATRISFNKLIRHPQNNLYGIILIIQKAIRMVMSGLVPHSHQKFKLSLKWCRLPSLSWLTALFGVILPFKDKNINSKKLMIDKLSESSLKRCTKFGQARSNNERKITLSLIFAFYIGFPDLIRMTSSAKIIDLARKRKFRT